MFAQISLNCYKSVLRFSNRDFDRTFVEILNSPNLDFRLRVTTTAKLFHADKNVSNEILHRKIKKKIVLKFICIKILKEFDPKHKLEYFNNVNFTMLIILIQRRSFICVIY